MNASLPPTFRFNVAVGQWAELDGKLAQFKGRARDPQGSLLFEDAEGVPTHMTDSTLLALQQSSDRRVRLLTPTEASRRLEESGKPRVTMAVNDPVANAGARRKLDYCHAWERAGRPARAHESLLPVIEGEFERRKVSLSEGEMREDMPPSTRTVERWLGDWLAGDGDIQALVPQVTKRGNEEDRLHPKARQILTEVVEERYLVTTRPTAVAVHRHVLRAFDDYNEPLPETERLPVPSLRSVYRTIRAIDVYTQVCTRLGRRAADIKFRPSGSSPQTTRHNEVWEIDHTTVDLIVVDEASEFPIGRPTVTLAIDRHTRMVVGFHIGFDPPGTFATMECLRNAILPKGAILDGKGLANPWPTMGTPETLVPDQGKEFKARAFIEALLTLGVDTQYTPVLKAWYKGKIERFFRTLATDVFHRVPGTTFSDIFDRNKETTPETVAIATLGQLRTQVLNYVVDVYHQRRHRSLGISPLEAWKRSVEIHGMRPLPDPDRVTTALSLVAYRKLHHYGIQFEGLIYNSADVAEVRARPGECKPVRLAIDPRDLTVIRFLDAMTNEWRTVPIQRSMAPHVRGVSLEKHKLARALQRANPARLAGEKGLVRAYTMLDDTMREMSGESGMKNRRKAARYWQALVAPKRAEEPPTFDVAESGRSLVDDLYGEFDEEPEMPAAPPRRAAGPKKPRAPDAAKAKFDPEPTHAPADHPDDDEPEEDDEDDIQPMKVTERDL